MAATIASASAMRRGSSASVRPADRCVVNSRLPLTSTSSSVFSSTGRRWFSECAIGSRESQATAYSVFASPYTSCISSDAARCSTASRSFASCSATTSGACSRSTRSIASTRSSPPFQMFQVTSLNHVRR